MRLVCISDTHTQHNKMEYDLKQYIKKNDYNVLIHAGDISWNGKKDEVTDFIYWFQNINGFDDKIFISGNHDFCFQRINKPHRKGEYHWLNHLVFSENLSQSNCTYLEDNELVLTIPGFSRPIKIYGSPWQPKFRDWAFNLPRNGKELEEKWNKIPNDTDILITHTPPHGIGDYTLDNIRVGCELLRFRVEQLQPLVHVYGHIHEGYGVSDENKTIFVNASTCNSKYQPINQPQIIEINEYYGEIIASHIYAE